MTNRVIESFKVEEMAITQKESPKRVYFQMCAELGDGRSCEITNSGLAVLERVGEWCREFGGQPGFSVEISTIELTAAEFRALPEL